MYIPKITHPNMDPDLEETRQLSHLGCRRALVPLHCRQQRPHLGLHRRHPPLRLAAARLQFVCGTPRLHRCTALLLRLQHPVGTDNAREKLVRC